MNDFNGLRGKINWVERFGGVRVALTIDAKASILAVELSSAFIFDGSPERLLIVRREVEADIADLNRLRHFLWCIGRSFGSEQFNGASLSRIAT